MTPYEHAIQRRWIKRTVEKRKKLLLDAWPGIPTRHRPDFYALSKESLETRRSGSSSFRDAYLLPFANLDDLSKPNNLPLFLNPGSGIHQLPSRSRTTSGVMLGLCPKASSLGI